MRLVFLKQCKRVCPVRKVIKTVTRRPFAVRFSCSDRPKRQKYLALRHALSRTRAASSALDDGRSGNNKSLCTLAQLHLLDRPRCSRQTTPLARVGGRDRMHDAAVSWMKQCRWNFDVALYTRTSKKRRRISYILYSSEVIPKKRTTCSVKAVVVTASACTT